jgi:hypothetical protein
MNQLWKVWAKVEMRWEALSPWWPDFVFWCWGFVDLVVSRWVNWIFVASRFEGVWLLSHVFQERSNSKIGLCMRSINILFHCSIRTMRVLYWSHLA